MTCFYLPMDLVRQANLGYVFANFMNVIRASTFWKAFNKYRWNVGLNRKTSQVSLATIQQKRKSLPYIWHSDQMKIYHS